MPIPEDTDLPCFSAKTFGGPAPPIQSTSKVHRKKPWVEAGSNIYVYVYVFIYIYMLAPPPQGPPFKIKSCVLLLLNKKIYII